MPANSNYYADASASGVAGAGTSPATAKQFVEPLYYFLDRSANQTLWLRGGRYYDVQAVGAGFPAFAKSHVRVRPYWLDGDVGNPCYDGRNWIAPNTNLFTYVGPAAGGGAVWSIQRGTAGDVARVFAGSRNNGVLLHQRTIGEALRHVNKNVTDNVASISNALSASDTWYGAGVDLTYKLYMWTPSETIDPSAYYEGLSFFQTGAGTTGFTTPFDLIRAQDIHITDIDIIGSRGPDFRIQNVDNATVPTCSIRIERCNGHAIYSNMIRALQTVTTDGIASGASMVREVVVRDCVANAHTGPREQDPTTQYVKQVDFSDFFYITDRLSDVLIYRCKTIDARHSAYGIGAFYANSAITKTSGFRHCTAYAHSWNTYARGIGSGDCEDSCFFDGGSLDGMNVMTQPAGGLLLSNFEIVNIRPRMRDNALTEAVIGIESYIVDRKTAGIGNERYLYNQPRNVRIVNVTIGPAYGPAVALRSYSDVAGSGLPAASIAAGSVTIDGTFVMDTRPERAGLPFLETLEQTGTSIGAQSFPRIAVYKNGETPKVNWKNVTYDAPVAPGFSETITDNPRVDEKLRPKKGSPLIGAAKRQAFNRRDVDGRERKSRPTIGAHESFDVKG